MTNSDCAQTIPQVISDTHLFEKFFQPRAVLLQHLFSARVFLHKLASYLTTNYKTCKCQVMILANHCRVEYIYMSLITQISSQLICMVSFLILIHKLHGKQVWFMKGIETFVAETYLKRIYSGS